MKTDKKPLSPNTTETDPVVTKGKFILPNSLLITAIIVLLFKLLLAFTTHGTDDVRTWEAFSNIIEKIGGVGLYKNLSYFNHPPFMVHVLQIFALLESVTSITLAFWIRALASLADLGSLIVTYRIMLQLYPTQPAPIKTLILMAVAPIAIMVSGFHGNTDPVFIFLLLLSIYLIDQNENYIYRLIPVGYHEYIAKFKLTNLALAGIIFGLSINIKIVPVIAAPCIFFYLANNRQRIEFFLAGALTWIIFSIPYVFIVPLDIIEHTFNYNSSYGHWGISRIFATYFPQDLWLNSSFANYGKFLIIGVITPSALLMNFVGKKPAIFIQVGITFFIFLALSPGFGIQYLSWLIPWCVALGIEATLAYYVTSSVYAFMLYNYWSTGLPWNYAYAETYHNFIRVYEYLCWITVSAIVLLYLAYIIAWKRPELKQQYFSDRVRQSFRLVIVSFLLITLLSGYKDLIANDGLNQHTIPGETYAAREKRLIEAAYVTVSRLYLESKLYQESINLCEKSLASNPNNADAYNNICYTYISMQEWSKAVEAGNKALQIDPNYQLAQNNTHYARLQLAKSGVISNTVTDMLSYLKTPPANFKADNFINISLELINKGDNNNAIIACEKALELAPNNSIAYNNMCIAYNNLFVYEEAEIACKKAIELSPNFILAQNNLNFTQSRTADKTAPKATAQSYINLSLTHFSHNKFEKSIYFADKALKLEPNNSIAYNNLCASYNYLGQWDKAIAAGERAVQIDPNFTLAKNNLDWAKRQKNK